MATERIEVAYRYIGGRPLGTEFYHKYIVYTNSNGDQFIAHGGPLIGLATGPIVGVAGPAGGPGLYEGTWAERQETDHRELIKRGADGESLESVWDAIKTEMKNFVKEGHDYDLDEQNSNSLVDTVLTRLELPLPQHDDEGEYYSPGSGNILDPVDNNPTILPNPLLIPDLPFLADLLNPPDSPLVLDMDGDGIELIALSDSQAMFDLDNDNFAQHTGWVAPDDALLAIDRNGNGRIDDIDEVFGSGTVDGFTELAALDSNGDGTIDASDARFGDLLLWRDKNGNGWSEADELQGLAEGGVESIALNATESDTTLAGHRISHTSSFTRTDGTTATIVDAWFENDRHISAYLPDDTFTLHEDVPALPELRGYGVVASLSVAMTLDAGLRQRVTDLVKNSDTLSMSDFRAGVEAMVLDWTGADTTDPGSRGPGMDARHLVAMEALAGNGFEQDDYAYLTNPGPIAAVVLEADFQNFIDAVTVRLLAQSAVSDFLVGVRESPNTADLADVYNHPFSWLATLPYRPEINELGGDLEGILNFYVGSHAAGSTPPLSIDDTLALLRMLRIDFGADEAVYRTSVEAAFVAAGFAATTAADYADRVVEPHMRYVNGTEGDDRLKGTSLDDVLVGGVGNDTYVWGSGQGNDVTDEEGAATDVDRLVLEGLAPDDIWVTRMSEGGYDADLLITIKATGERLILDDQLGSNRETIEEVEFANGVVWNGEELKQNTFQNILVGSDEADTLEGSTGQDYIDGGLGDDTLEGGDGSDTYVFNRGDGADSIEDNGLYDTDRLVIHGYAPADVTVGRSAPDSDDVVLTFAGTEDRITIVNTLGGSRYDTVERIEFDDGTVWTPADLRTSLLTGGNGDDVLHGFDTDDTITGGAGDDTLYGGDGSDTYVFNRGDGVDSIEDSGYNDTDRLVIRGYAPADVTVGRSAPDSDDAVLTFAGTEDRITIVNTLGGSRYDTVERIEFDDGTVWTPADLRTSLLTGGNGDEVLHGFDTDDTITGGLGDDTLQGGDGSDTYVFNRGDGVDSIEDSGYNDTDRLVIRGYAPADVTVGRTAPDSDDVVLTFAGTEDRITIVNTLGGSRYDTVERIEFDDGTVWTPADLRTSLLTGGNGDDVLHGFDTDDTITGGAGDDTLYGGDGSDTYVFNRGDGVDSIEDSGYNDTDRLVIRGYAPADVTVGRTAPDSDDVVLTFAGTEDRITIVNTLGGSRQDTVERIEFDDGTVWTPADLRTSLLTGGNGDEVLHGFDTDDTITGGGGDDTLYGGDGDDTLTGGADDDILHGSLGDDSFDGGAGTDTIDFSYSASDADFDLGAEQVRFSSGHTEQIVSIENVIGTLGANVITGTGGANRLEGRAGNDTLNGGAGNDTLYGGDGDDTLTGGADDDILHGSLGDDSFDGGAGTDTIDFSYSASDADFDLSAGQVRFSSGHTEQIVSIENVIGTLGANVITGTAGANRLEGRAGNDTLNGGGGNDILSGGAGADTFVFDADDGMDTIEDFEDGTDLIRFDAAGLTFAGLTITDDDGDAMITYDTGDSIRLMDMDVEDLDASDFAFA